SAVSSTSPITAPRRATIAPAISPRSARLSRRMSSVSPARATSSVSERIVTEAEVAVPSAGGGTWTHLLARACVRPLLGTPITPNPIPAVRLLTGLAACLAVAIGTVQGDLWGGILWVLSAFLDRADGELARIGGKTTAWGHTYDYICDTVVTPLFFLCAGIGLGSFWILLGAIGGGSVVFSKILSETPERRMPQGQPIPEGPRGFAIADPSSLP